MGDPPGVSLSPACLAPLLACFFGAGGESELNTICSRKLCGVNRILLAVGVVPSPLVFFHSWTPGCWRSWGLPPLLLPRGIRALMPSVRQVPTQGQWLLLLTETRAPPRPCARAPLSLRALPVSCRVCNSGSSFHLWEALPACSSVSALFSDPCSPGLSRLMGRSRSSLSSRDLPPSFTLRMSPEVRQMPVAPSHCPRSPKDYSRSLRNAEHLGAAD